MLPVSRSYCCIVIAATLLRPCFSIGAGAARAVAIIGPRPPLASRADRGIATGLMAISHTINGSAALFAKLFVSVRAGRARDTIIGDYREDVPTAR